MWCKINLKLLEYLRILQLCYRLKIECNKHFNQHLDFSFQSGGHTVNVLSLKLIGWENQIENLMKKHILVSKNHIKNSVFEWYKLITHIKYLKTVWKTYWRLVKSINI